MSTSFHFYFVLLLFISQANVHRCVQFINRRDTFAHWIWSCMDSHEIEISAWLIVHWSSEWLKRKRKTRIEFVMEMHKIMRNPNNWSILAWRISWIWPIWSAHRIRIVDCCPSTSTSIYRCGVFRTYRIRTMGISASFQVHSKYAQATGTRVLILYLKSLLIIRC